MPHQPTGRPVGRPRKQPIPLTPAAMEGSSRERTAREPKARRDAEGVVPGRAPDAGLSELALRARVHTRAHSLRQDSFWAPIFADATDDTAMLYTYSLLSGLSKLDAFRFARPDLAHLDESQDADIAVISRAIADLDRASGPYQRRSMIAANVNGFWAATLLKELAEDGSVPPGNRIDAIRTALSQLNRDRPSPDAPVPGSINVTVNVDQRRLLQQQISESIKSAAGQGVITITRDDNPPLIPEELLPADSDLQNEEPDDDHRVRVITLG